MESQSCMSGIEVCRDCTLVCPLAEDRLRVLKREAHCAKLAAKE